MWAREPCCCPGCASARAPSLGRVALSLAMSPGAIRWSEIPQESLTRRKPAMRKWRDVLLTPSATLGDAIGRIDAAGYQIALIVESDDRLLGVVTDGDVRRAILQGKPLSAPVTALMNASPVTAVQGISAREQLAVMRRHVIHQLPIVNPANRVVGLVLIDDLIGATEKPNWAVLMAGGLGARLRPLTESVPKPMLIVRGKPILEGIVENLVSEGFRRLYLSVNYRADTIMDHFGD